MRLDVSLPAKEHLRHKVHSCPKIAGICEMSAEQIESHIDNVKNLNEMKVLLKSLAKMVVHLHLQNKRG
jgi:hypothetical protein